MGEKKKEHNKKERKEIPADIKRKALIECGFKCSMPKCITQWPTLQFHHIDENPSNNTLENILVLCPTHHQLATSKHIIRKDCKAIKNILNDFGDYDAPNEITRRNQLLYSLIAELHANLILLCLSFPNEVEDATRVFPHLQRIVADNVIASGAFIYDQDKELYNLLYNWVTSLTDFNRRLDITEIRDYARLSQEEIVNLRKTLVKSNGFLSNLESCLKLYKFLIKNYGEEAGVNKDTVLFDVECKTFFGDEP